MSYVCLSSLIRSKRASLNPYSVNLRPHTRKARRSQEEPGGARRSQGEPGGARGSQEEPGGARRSQEEPGANRDHPDL